jgi:hypothetical protein
METYLLVIMMAVMLMFLLLFLYMGYAEYNLSPERKNKKDAKKIG